MIYDSLKVWYIYQLGIHIILIILVDWFFSRFVLSGWGVGCTITFNHQHSGTAGAALLPSKIYFWA